MKLLLALLLLATTATAQTCPNRIKLKVVPATSRTGVIIYKSNWNMKENRENTIEEGNHSQKGAALLIDYRQRRYLPTSRQMEIRDINCRLVAHAGRYPRCTSTGCGNWERWYLRAPGGSGVTVPGLSAALGGNTALFRLKGRQWAVVQNVYDDREVAR